jgi:tRNA threonylcarbamoyladenosine biosynthesis protein TsaB
VTALVLGIETATVMGGVALVSDTGELLGEITLRNHESHSERMLPALAWLLATLGLSLRDCAAVAVSQGPGSFTGLRAGIATAKGLAFSLGVPLFGISTLEALAANAPPAAGPVCAVLNARRGEVFRALFRRGPAGPQRLEPDRLLPLQSFADELPDDCLVLGELPAAFCEMLPPGRGVRFAPAHLGQPRAAVIAALGSAARDVSRASELTTLMPHYLRPCDAVTGGTGP